MLRPFRELPRRNRQELIRCNPTLSTLLLIKTMFFSTKTLPVKNWIILHYPNNSFSLFWEDFLFKLFTFSDFFRNQITNFGLGNRHEGICRAIVNQDLIVI